MASNTGRSDQRALLLCTIDEAFDKAGWVGVTLRGAIRRIAAREASWRPRPGRHSIAEIVLHSAYWKYIVNRRITGGKRGSFPLKGSDWFTVPARLTDGQWKKYLAILDGAHRSLRETVATAPWPRLTSLRGSSRLPTAHTYGIAMHDVYHTGQIKTIRALYRQATARRKRKPEPATTSGRTRRTPTSPAGAC